MPAAVKTDLPQSYAPGLDREMASLRAHRQSELADRYLFECECLNRELVSLRLRSNKLSSNLDSTVGPLVHRTNDFKDVYISRLSRQTAIGQTAVRSRSVPSTPERILDAPGLVDDFYLNVLDWSVRNVLAVALGPSVYMWNGQDGTVRELMSLHGNDQDTPYVSSLSWMHDGKSIAVGTSGGCVQIWDVEMGRKLRTMIATQESRVSALSWNRHLLSSGSRNGAVLTHDVRVAKHLSTAHETCGAYEVCGLSWDPEGRQLASGTNENSIHIWDTGSSSFARAQLVLEGHRSAIKALAWCPWRSNILASGGGSQDKKIKLWSTLTGECIETADAGCQVSSLLWSRTSRELVSAHGYDRNHLAVWRVNSMARELEQVAAIDSAHESRILHMRMSPDGRTIATAAADESIKFWPIFNTHSSSSKKDASPPPSNPPKANVSPFSLRTKSFR